MRRHPRAIITAHLMDPARKDLFVEGPNDRIFLNWITQDIRNPNARVLGIETVDVPGFSAGGDRARLLEFARLVVHSSARILVLADADLDRLLDRPVPSNVVLTDGRDLEGYILRLDCIDKVLKLGLRDEQTNAKELLDRTIEHARYIGFMRITSELDKLNLPFQRTRVDRFVTLVNGRVIFDASAYLRSLLQNAGISLGRLDEIKSRVDKIAASHSIGSPMDLIHGKDAVKILEKVFMRFGVHTGEGNRLLWCSFECVWAADHTNLQKIIQFLGSRSETPGQSRRDAR